VATSFFWILLQHLLKLVQSPIRHLLVLWRLGARDVLHVVRHRQVETGGREGGIELNGRLEPLYSLCILRALISLHAAIQIVTRLEFVAAGGDKCQRGDPNQRGLVAFHYCPASI